jgi:hypothetical protein
MSSRNKVNPGQYTQAGRLSPDDAAREQKKMNAQSGISNRESAAEETEERQRHPARPASDKSSFDLPDRDDTPASEAGDSQTSAKAGSRSMAQKEAESKYANRPHPGSEKVDGAFGREGNKSTS